MKSAAEERELKRGIYHQTHTGELVSERQTTSLYESEHVYITCAYCRVSTDSESQLSSYELQREHYEKLADSHPNWDLRHIFADEGISGTSMKKREAWTQG